LTSNDGRDVGIRLHYYKTSDKHAFIGWENATQALTYYQDATETNGVVTGTLGNVELGSLYVSNTTAATSTTTGALQVRGGAGISGNIFTSNLYVTTDIFFAGNNNRFIANAANFLYVVESPDDSVAYNIPYVSPSGSANAYRQLYSDDTGLTFNPSTNVLTVTNISTSGITVAGGTVSATGVSAGTVSASTILTASANTASTGTTTGALVVTGGAGIGGQLWIRGIGGRSITATGTIAITGTGANLQLPNGATLKDTSGDAVAFGQNAGLTSQGTNAVAIGNGAASNSQGASAVAIGYGAANSSQGVEAVAIGTFAGYGSQGVDAVAIGYAAGYSSQGNNSIILNATGGVLNQTTANTFTVAPVRNDVTTVNQVMFYNTTSKEVTYGNTISVAGNINASQFNFANGVNILSTISAGSTYSNVNVEAYIGGNIGSYQTYANANAATQTATINSIDANVGSFQTYANTKIGTNTNGNLVVVATTSSTDANTGALVVRGGAGIGGDMYIAGNIVPAANVTYDLGSSTTWFRDLWLSAGTIHIGGAKITQDPASGAIAIVPKATASNPNPKATVFSATGAVITANTAAGVISSETIATAAASTDFNVIGNLTANTATITGNVSAGKIYTTNGLYWAGNGVEFSSGVSFIASATPPAAPALGDQWYNTTDDVLYEFIANYWVDIQSPTIGASDYNNVSVDNIAVTANVTTANVYADRFFYSNGTAFSSSNYGNTEVVAYLAANPQGSTYSNTNVEAYLGANLGSATTNITTLFSNAATQATSINGINANLGTATTNINTTNANIGAFQTYANLHFSDTSFSNSNVASYFTSNNSGMSSRTDAITIPIGTTGQRPTATANGMMRYNATLGSVEIYLPSGGWTSLISDRYTVEYLVVAGGGGGASRHSGGGGAGGMLTATGFTVTPTTAYTVTVGAGGTGNTTGGTATDGSPGFDSVFASITATGGGKGGGTAPGTGGNGGSGGGGGNGALGGSGTPGQGYAGGKNSSPAYDYHGGGGGGAGGVGGDVTGGAGGTGGPGATSDITGTSVIYACGGGGSAYQGLGSGGDGGAGGSSNVNGGKGAGTSSGTAGTANTGTGGGGGTAGEGAYNGGSGVVIVRYLGPQRGSGGTYSSSGGYSIHRFTSSGTFTA